MGFSAILERSLLSELLRLSSLGVSGSPLALPLRNSCFVAFARRLASDAFVSSSLSFTATACFLLTTFPASTTRTPSTAHLGDTELEPLRGGFSTCCVFFRELDASKTSENDFVIRALCSFLDCLALPLPLESPPPCTGSWRITSVTTSLLTPLHKKTQKNEIRTQKIKSHQPKTFSVTQPHSRTCWVRPQMEDLSSQLAKEVR